MQRIFQFSIINFSAYIISFLPLVLCTIYLTNFKRIAQLKVAHNRFLFYYRFYFIKNTCECMLQNKSGIFHSSSFLCVYYFNPLCQIFVQVLLLYLRGLVSLPSTKIQTMTDRLAMVDVYFKTVVRPLHNRGHWAFFFSLSEYKKRTAAHPYHHYVCDGFGGAVESS